VEQKKIPSDRLQRNRELGSWKEIAHYLGVNIRTAQKWERERGMPVRRSAGTRGRVSADADALESWKNRSLQGELQRDSFGWPLAPNLRVELRFVGRQPQTADLELLRQYLTLLKRALADHNPP
jgi:phage terminase Nu1 subunit (DNA packaging protein)